MVNYREAYGLHAVSGILFNHESPLRDMRFVSRKITAALAALAHGGQAVLTLGNIDNVRDWGFAGDYVQAMWLMLQQDTPDDFVIASGKTHSVRQFVERGAQALGLALTWEGEGTALRGIDAQSGRQLVAIDEAFYRPTEPDPLIGDATKIRTQLGWQAQTDFNALVSLMVDADTAILRAKQ